MKRACLLLVSVLSLAACAPTTSPVVGGGAVAVVDPADEGRAYLSATWAEQSKVGFYAGSLDAYDLVLRVSGDGLRINAPNYCRVDVRDILCTVPSLPAGRNFMLPMRGSRLSVVATYKRASGHTYRSQVHQ